MGGEQAASVLATVRRDQFEARGEAWPAEDGGGVHGARPRAVRAPGQRRTTPPPGSGTTASSTRWTPGTVLGLALSACANAPLDAPRRTACSGCDRRRSPMFDTVPGRQPRRDRGPRHPHPAPARHPLASPCTATPTPTPGTSATPTSPSGIGAADAAPPRATCTSTRSSRRPRATGAQAVHPGYGFLAENAGFARACAEAGLVFIGPPAGAIELMGDKIDAKAAVGAAGVPVVPGSERRRPDRRGTVAAAAEEIGFPVLVKPSAGGGGKGMRLVRDAGRAAGRDRRRPAGGPDRVRRRHPASRALRRPPPPHRGPGPRRRPRHRRAPRRARVQPAAAAPEDHRGGTRRPCSTRRRRAAMGAAAVACRRSVRLHRRRHGRVHRARSRRPEPTSSSWR